MFAFINLILKFFDNYHHLFNKLQKFDATNCFCKTPHAVQTPIKYAANLKPLVHRPPLISCEICVIVPVRDEAENIEATLLALTNQCDRR